MCKNAVYRLIFAGAYGQDYLVTFEGSRAIDRSDQLRQWVSLVPQHHGTSTASMLIAE